MSDDAFSKGDAVKVAALGNSPMMLVESIGNDDRCTCVWFTESKDFRRESFDRGALKAVPKPAAPQSALTPIRKKEPRL